MVKGGPMDVTPIGLKPNWVTSVGGLPLYIRAVAHAFIRSGTPESEAIHRAVGVVHNWADGHDGHGHAVSAETIVKARAAILEWDRKRAQSHAKTAAKNLAHGDRMDTIDLAAFTAEQRRQMAAKGQAMKGGGFPIPNTSFLSKAIHAYGRAKNKKATRAHIKNRAKALGASHMLPSSWTGKPKTASMSAERLQGLVDLANTNPRIRKVLVKKIRERRLRNPKAPVKMRRINPMPKGKRL